MSEPKVDCILDVRADLGECPTWCAQEQALYRAHVAVDTEAQRAAIADWVYWQHLAVLMWEATGADANA